MGEGGTMDHLEPRPLDAGMDGRVLYLSESEVERVAPDMSTVIGLLERAFREKGEGRIEMPPKPGIHPQPDAFIHAMPAFIPSLGSAGVKWVSGYPTNQARGLPYISGLLILNDPATGIPYAVMGCVWITAVRTAAASALSARYLARRESETLGILGCGVQGRTHVEALRVVLPGLRTLLAYDIDRSKASRFADEMAAAHGLTATAVETPREAVSGCDVVVTAGPILRRPHATIKAGWVEAGAFVSAVDFDSYFDARALAEFDKVTTDDVAQLHHFRDVGYFQSFPPIHADLGDLVLERKPGRETPGERTMACNLGVALDDMAVAPTIFARARELGVGTLLRL